MPISPNLGFPAVEDRSPTGRSLSSLQAARKGRAGGGDPSGGRGVRGTYFCGVVAASAFSACVLPPPPAPPQTSFGAPDSPPTITRLVPLPRQLTESPAQLKLEPSARIVADASLGALAQSLADVLRRSTGFELPIAM